jgi:glycosyltransferase involved in cell wall biosynthesis
LPLINGPFRRGNWRAHALWIMIDVVPVVALDCRMVPRRLDGLGRYVSSLAEALAHAERSFDLTLLVPGDLEPGHPLGRATEWPVRVVLSSRSAIGPSNQLTSLWTLRTLNTDLYHYPHFDLPFRSPRPSVVTVHDITPLVFREFFRGAAAPLKRAYFWAATARALHRAAAVIVPSQASAGALREHFNVPADRLRVVYEGVSSLFSRVPRADEIGRTLRTYGVARPYVLYVGVDRPHKNLGALVRAFARIAAEVDLDLLIVGQRVDRSDLDELVFALGLQTRVRRIGYVPDDHLICLYRSATAFVLCSLFEGFGLPVVEAMASMVPVIVSKGSAGAEVADNAALLVDPHSETSIAAALLRVARDENLREELRRRGSMRVANFQWTDAARRTIDIYEGLFLGRAAAPGRVTGKV